MLIYLLSINVNKHKPLGPKLTEKVCLFAPGNVLQYKNLFKNEKHDLVLIVIWSYRTKKIKKKKLVNVYQHYSEKYILIHVRIILFFCFRLLFIIFVCTNREKNENSIKK